ncbi:hypothetical protein DPMN_007381 [Dreissena polymorpha]|uniref:Uncharacterized protein n=1 Tax=Dreissena polymorpha TaxID=45954 RepID=A0A9D4RVZ6_DREPO|nr:hypothetical protein DPMN_007381 [Dreissena polymorpha]
MPRYKWSDKRSLIHWNAALQVVKLVGPEQECSGTSGQISVSLFTGMQRNKWSD